MVLALRIAARYLFSKKSHSAINVISIISVCGVAIITAALICTLSVYNGFTHLIGSLLSEIQPDIKILPASGKTLDGNDTLWSEIAAWDDVALLSPVIEETALAVYDRQLPVVVKGIPDNYDELTGLSHTIVTGEYMLHDSIVPYAIIGAGVAVRLEAGVAYSRPIELYAPHRRGRVNIANPAASFTSRRFFVSAAFYSNQAPYDDNVVYIPIDEARVLFDYPTEATAIELRCADGVAVERVVQQLEKKLGSNYVVQDRYKQNGESFRWMQIEKWITFLILVFILLIAAFNIVGALSMLIVDKKENIATLRNLGADNRLIVRIFMTEGWLISMIGALSGLVIGVLLCWLQQEFGLLRLGESGAFIVDAYPVRLEWGDTLVVTAVVLLLGMLTASFPARMLRRSM